MVRRIVWILALGAAAAGCGDDEDVLRDSAVNRDGASGSDGAPSDGGGDDASPMSDAAMVDAQGADGGGSGYTVATSAATYNALANETAIALGGDLDNGVGTVTIPFGFDFFGAPVTTLSVSPNGFAATTGLTAPGGGQNTTFPQAAPPNGILAPWWEDLELDTQVSGGASLSQELVGTAPNRALIIQWRGVRVAIQSTGNHRRFHFQLALFESSNVIEFRYGDTLTSGSPATQTSASVGIEDATGTIGQEVLTCTPTCQGQPRPTTPNGFPTQTLIRLTPR